MHSGSRYIFFAHNQSHFPHLMLTVCASCSAKQEVCSRVASFDLTAVQRASCISDLHRAVEVVAEQRNGGASMADSLMGGVGDDAAEAIGQSWEELLGNLRMAQQLMTGGMVLHDDGIEHEVVVGTCCLWRAVDGVV